MRHLSALGVALQYKYDLGPGHAGSASPSVPANFRSFEYTATQGAIDESFKGNIITISECVATTASLTILLSMVGLDLDRLYMPVGFACAYAAKDLLHNFLAGVGTVIPGLYQYGRCLA